MDSSSNHQETHPLLILLAIWTVEFLQNSIIKAIGVLLPVLKEQFESDARTIGAAASLIMFMHLVGLTAQPLSRIFKARTIIMTCGVLSAAGLLLGSLAPNIHVLVLAMFLTGFTSMGDVIAIGLIPAYFTKHYTIVVNIVKTGLPLAVLSFAPMTQLFIDTYGWRGAMLLLGALKFHYVVAAALLRPPLEQPNQDDMSYECIDDSSDTESDNDSSNDGFVKTCLSDTFNKSLLTNGAFLIVLLMSVVNGYIFNGLVVYLVSIAQSKGLSPYDAATVATISGLGILLIRITMAIFQGKTSYRHLFYVGSILAVTSYTGMYFANSFLTLCLASFTLGAADGIIGSQVFIGVYATAGKEDAIKAVAWASIFKGIGYLSCGYISGKYKDGQVLLFKIIEE
ncbi:monocarboxylate transporter 2-like [Amphiura filiformis]|uniref:monocarboxylate transporter 2-like n=1 Tax=Amphiura filiformis TaxID=82378 RepID=UPI003B2274F0